LFVPQPEAFLARFDPAASTLVFATYVNVGGAIGLSVTLAVAPDGIAYLGSSAGIYRIDATRVVHAVGVHAAHSIGPAH
jgi:hypothetical protein